MSDHNVSVTGQAPNPLTIIITLVIVLVYSQYSWCASAHVFLVGMLIYADALNQQSQRLRSNLGREHCHISPSPQHSPASTKAQNRAHTPSINVSTPRHNDPEVSHARPGSTSVDMAAGVQLQEAVESAGDAWSDAVDTTPTSHAQRHDGAESRSISPGDSGDERIVSNQTPPSELSQPERQPSVLSESSVLLSPKPSYAHEQPVLEANGQSDEAEISQLSDDQRMAWEHLVAACGRGLPEEILPENKLGAGAHGAVYRVSNLDNGVEYAAKFLPLDRQTLEHGVTEPAIQWLGRVTEEQRRFALEAKMMRELNLHPNIVTFLGRKLCDRPSRVLFPRQYLQLELASGTLASGPVISSRSSSLSLLRDMVSGLIHLKAHNIIHRDIKPENILVFEGARASPETVPGLVAQRPVYKLADFGCAGRVGEMSDGAYGSSEYLAPESQMSNQYSFAGDLYSVYATWLEVRTLIDSRDTVHRSQWVARRHHAIATAWKRDVQYGGTFKDLAAYEPEDRPTAEAVLARIDELLTGDAERRAEMARRAAARLKVLRADAARRRRREEEQRAIDEMELDEIAF